MDDKAGVAQLARDLAAGVAMPRMDQPIVLTAQPIVRWDAQQEQPARLEDAPDLVQRRGVVAYAEVVDDFEARGGIERRVAKRQALDRCAAEPRQAAGARRLERFPRHVNADYLAEAP